MLEQPRPVGPRGHAPVLLVGDPEADEVERRSGLVDGRDDAEARAGERAGALDDLAQHGGEVEALVDAQDCGAQARDAPLQRFDLLLKPGAIRQCSGAPSDAAPEFSWGSGRVVRGAMIHHNLFISYMNFRCLHTRFGTIASLQALSRSSSAWDRRSETSPLELHLRTGSEVHDFEAPQRRLAKRYRCAEGSRATDAGTDRTWPQVLESTRRVTPANRSRDSRVGVDGGWVRCTAAKSH